MMMRFGNQATVDRLRSVGGPAATLAAEVLDRLKIGHVLLSGSVPSKERKALLERFRDNAAGNANR